MALIKGKQIESLKAEKVIESDDKQFISLEEKQDLRDISTFPISDEYGIHCYYIRKVSNTSFIHFTENAYGDVLDAQVPSMIEVGSNSVDLRVYYTVPFTQLPISVNVTGIKALSDTFTVGSPMQFQQKSYSIIQISRNGTTLKWNTDEVPVDTEVQVLIMFKKDTVDARTLVDLSNYYTKDETYNKEEVDNKIATIDTTDPNSHTHDNKSIIDSLSDSSNMLTYKGKVVVNNNEYSFRTLPRAKVVENYSTVKGGRLPWLV